MQDVGDIKNARPKDLTIFMAQRTGHEQNIHITINSDILLLCQK